MGLHRERRNIKRIGRRIRELRISQGISQSQLAFESSMPRVQIGRIERGEINTTIGALITISRVLNVHLKELLEVTQ